MSRWDDQPPGFNTAAAETVYRTLMKMDDDAALVFGRILVADCVRHDLVTKRAELVKSLDARARRNATALRKRLARTAVSKSRTSADNVAELQVLSLVAKATQYDRDETGRFAHVNTLGGHHAEAHLKIGYDPDFKTLRHRAALTAHGIPHPGNTFSDDKHVGRYQQAYAQIADMVRPFRHGMNDSTVLRITTRNPIGETDQHFIDMPKRGEPFDLHSMLGHDDHVVSATVYAAPPISAGGAAYDALAAAGAPRAGAFVAGSVDRLTPESVRRLGENLRDGHEQDEFIPSQRAFRNLAHGSKFLDDTFGDALPGKARLALQVGEHVGRMGPEAQRVIGPSADRAAYRYRGTERSVSRDLGDRLTMIGQARTVPDKRAYLLGLDAERNQRGEDFVGSPVLNYFRSKLPKVEHNQLQLKAGRVPPSRGIVIDQQGQVHSEAVGYGDDWYLPFNLRKLKSLKGGEYIRTRTFGGPTTEDIYAGLISGARSMTVVSHSGVYTVELADDLRGGRRFNDKAAQMVGRYGHLLDAVRNGEVEVGDIHPTRMAELREKAGESYDEEADPTRYNAELKKLIARERQPGKAQLSQAQKVQAARQFFAEEVPGGRGVGQARLAQVSDYVRETAGRRREADMARHGQALPMSAYEHRERQAIMGDGSDALAQAERMADAIGARPELEAAMKRAEVENAEHIRVLSLDGAGYKTALDALEEQFPQYIAGVHFHPWSDATRRRDSGYVNPRANRAADALSGYYEAGPGPEGAQVNGKVRAESTRWQGGNKTLHRVQARTEQTSTPEGQRAAGQVKAKGDLAPDVQREMEADAARDLVTGLRSGTISPQAMAGIGGSPQAGAHGMLATEAFGHDEIAALYPAAAKVLRPDFDIDAALRSDRTGAMALVRQAHAEVKAKKLLDGVSTRLSGAFERGGMPEGEAARPETWAAGLGDADKDWDDDSLPRAYQRSEEPTREQVEAAYRSYPGRRAVADRLPDLDAPDFRARADALLTELRGARREQTLRQRDGYAARPAQDLALERRAEGALHALRLHRRHGEAIKREADDARARAESAAREHAAATPDLRQSIVFAGNPEDYQNMDPRVVDQVRGILGGNLPGGLPDPDAERRR